MAYHGFLSPLKRGLYELPHPPSVLEIGIDRAVTFFTLATFLVRTKEEFSITGIDVLVQEQVQIMVQHLDRTEKQAVNLVEDNSLNVLPKLVEAGVTFDLILVDGDHNYHTVKQELNYLDKISRPHTIVIVDDYSGRWSDRDLFYSERPGYENVKCATPHVDTEKHGVKSAVDEWLAANERWSGAKELPGEPIVLRQNQKFTR